MQLSDIINIEKHPIMDDDFTIECKKKFDRDGLIVLEGFLNDIAIDSVKHEGEENKDNAYYCEQNHNVYLMPSDPDFSNDHARNREVLSTKGLIADDQISGNSVLRTIYDSEEFKNFICQVIGEDNLYPYADDLSSINLHYHNKGQELGWHYDNSTFAITLMIQPTEKGGAFEYVRDVRDADNGDMNYAGTLDVIQGTQKPEILEQPAGALALFRGKNSIHRVTPNEGDRTRMLVVLAYNNQPGIALSDKAKELFYGRQ